MTKSDEDRLHALVCECIERIEAEGPSVIEALCTAHPGHAARLRLRIRALLETGMLEASARAEAESWPERLGDFRLLRPIATGGMGVVYLAQQLSVGREVALKLVRPELLYFPGARQRFQREVEAVARLADPGIVPIHAVGEEGGIPYYAMEYVRGPSLAELLAGLAGRCFAELAGEDLRRAIERHGAAAPPAGSSRARLFARPWPEACAQLVAEVAHAVDHAHQRGVLHRDLKPSNVLLTPLGRPVVVDFGLAVVADSGRITRTGSQLGSLPYMAPEQLRGETARLSPATDVYCLGVTLYELVGGELPHQGEGAAALEREILAGRARGLRARNPRASRDLETIVAKALEAEPERRYTSAGEFAQDLERVLGHQPVSARRIGPLGRARRWSRRHPGAAAALALALLATASLPAALAWQTRRSEAAVARAASGVAHAREQARASLAAALDMIDFVLQRAGAERLGELPALLETALRAFDALEAAGAPLELVVESRGRIESQLGAALLRLGRSGEARAAWERIVAGCERASAQSPERRELRYLHAVTLANLALCLQDVGERERAEESLDRAELLLAALPPEGRLGIDAASVRVVIGVHRARGLIFDERDAEAAAAYAGAVSVAEELRAAGHGSALLDQREAVARDGWASMLDKLGSREGALEHWERAEERFASAFAGAASPAGADLEHDAATCAHFHGGALLRAGRLDDAQERLLDADRRLAALHASYPEAVDFTQMLAETQSVLAHLAHLRGSTDESLARFDRCVALLEDLRARLPADERYRRSLALALNNRAELLTALDRHDEAFGDLEQAGALVDGQGALADAPPRERLNRCWILVALASAQIARGELTQGMGLLERVEEAGARQGLLLRGVAEGWARVAEQEPALEASDGRYAEERALDALRSAIEAGWRDATDLTSDPAWHLLRESPPFQELVDGLVLR